MATIITKNSTGSGVTPSSLQQGELAINIVDGRLFYGSGSGNIVKEFTGSGGGSGTTFPYTGSAIISGSLVVTGSTTSTGGFTGSLFGTASWATNVVTASAAGTNTMVQYNNNGVLGGSSKFTFDGGTALLSVAGGITTKNTVTVSGSLIVSGTYGGINTFVNKPNLFDINGITRVQWSDGVLISSVGDPTLDWENKVLHDSATNTVLDWENKVLYDSTGASSIDWENRSINDPTNTFTALGFSDPNYTLSDLYHRAIIQPQTQQSIADQPAFTGQIIGATVDAGVGDFQLVYLDTDGTWYPTKAGIVYGANKMLGICVDQASGYVLIEGDVGVSDDDSQGAYVIGADHGLPVYVSATTGVMTVTAPSGTGEVVRIVGHIYYQSTTDTNWWTMKFRPSNDWYVL